jgi:hypothetical protein
LMDAEGTGQGAFLPAASHNELSRPGLSGYLRAPQAEKVDA